MEPKETCNSGPKVAVSHAKSTDEGWDTETCNSGPKFAVIHSKTTDEGRDP